MWTLRTATSQDNIYTTGTRSCDTGFPLFTGPRNGIRIDVDKTRCLGTILWNSRDFRVIANDFISLIMNSVALFPLHLTHPLPLVLYLRFPNRFVNYNILKSVPKLCGFLAERQSLGLYVHQNLMTIFRYWLSLQQSTKPSYLALPRTCTEFRAQENRWCTITYHADLETSSSWIWSYMVSSTSLATGWSLLFRWRNWIRVNIQTATKVHSIRSRYFLHHRKHQTGSQEPTMYDTLLDIDWIDW